MPPDNSHFFFGPVINFRACVQLSWLFFVLCLCLSTIGPVGNLSLVPLSRALPSDLLDAAWSCYHWLAVTPAHLSGRWATIGERALSAGPRQFYNYNPCPRSHVPAEGERI